MDALVSATRVNADSLGIAHETGTIEVGKQPAIVAFAADPLSDLNVVADPREVALVLKPGGVVKDTLSWPRVSSRAGLLGTGYVVDLLHAFYQAPRYARLLCSRR